MAAEGLPVQTACRVLAVSESGFYASRGRQRSERAIRHAWLTELCQQVHTDSRGTYGARRVHAELTLGRGLTVGHNQVELVMRRAGIQGLTGRPGWKRVKNLATAADLVNRDFGREDRDRLWVTDITEHRTREGKLYCCAVLDTYSRRVVGWSIDSAQTATLVTNALSMAIDNRQPAGTIIHSDQGVQFTSWLFAQRIKEAGLTPSMGSIGDCFDNSMIESFWSRMQVELLDRRRWNTRVELATAIFEYLEIFHNRQRRHSALGMLTPVEFETRPTVSAA
jgi:putative transposase